MKLPHPFIQLPLKFDADRLAAEVAAIPERDWRPHPQNFPGNSMLPMVAINGDPANENFGGEMRPTPFLDRCPYLRQAMAAIGVTLGRTRLMRLAGQAEVTPHVDQGYYWADRVRVHIPIVTQPAVKFYCGDTHVHMGAGECWIFDTWRLHRVINADNHQRIHLVIDTVGGSEFWRLVEAGRPMPDQGRNPGWSPRTIPFQPDTNPELALESANIPSVMTPWEVEAHLGLLLRELPDHPNRQTVFRHVSEFTRDWRALWARFGVKPEGRTLYEQRLMRFFSSIQGSAGAIELRNGANLFGAMVIMVGSVALGEDTGMAKGDMG